MTCCEFLLAKLGVVLLFLVGCLFLWVWVLDFAFGCFWWFWGGFGELGFAAAVFVAVVIWVFPDCGLRLAWCSCGLHRLVCFVSGWCLAVVFDFSRFWVGICLDCLV